MSLHSIYQPEDGFGRQCVVDFTGANPVDVFARTMVYVEFDSDRHGRQPVVNTVVGYPGRWLLAYSSLQRLQRACADDDVEYSALSGVRLMSQAPEGVGVYFDLSYAGGRPILQPPLGLGMEPQL
jgi:hypothetical protein